MILEHGRLCCSHSALLSTEGSVTFIILHYCQQRALLHSLFSIFLKTIAISSDLFSNSVISYYEITNAQFV